MSTTTTGGALLAGNNKFGGVVPANAYAKSNFPITQSILQNTDGVKKEQSFPNMMGFDNSKENMERLKKALREKAEQHDKERGNENDTIGAPIVKSNNDIVNGNNRTAAIKYSYSGNTNGAKQYRALLIKSAKQFGLN